MTKQKLEPQVVAIGEERFEQVVAEIRDYAIFLLDAEGRVATWNAGAEQIKGYTAAEIIGRHFSVFYPPDVVESGWPEHELKLATATGRFEDEAWRVRKGGTRFWANVVITARRDPAGRLLGFTKITRDLTERKRQEESLKESEERFRLLVQGVTDYAIFTLDPDGFVTSWNAGAEQIDGYTAGEIIGQHFSRFYLPEDVHRKWPEHELAVAAAEGRFEDEGWRVRKDGSRFWSNVVITALRDQAGTLRGFSKITRDLTERRLHEETLRQSEERFRLLIEGVADYAIFLVDPSGHITSWNTGAERLSGLTAAEAIGKHVSICYTAQDVAENVPERELASARSHGRFEVESWRLRKDGSRFLAHEVVTSLRDHEGRPRGFAKVARDLTQRRRAEELEDRSRQITEFLAMLAHELRNPLAPIRNAISVMQILPAVDPSLRWSVEVLDRQVSHLTRLVDDLLDVGRITSGNIILKREPVDLAMVVSRAVEGTRPLINARNHELEVSLPPEPVLVAGDMTRLTQVVLNLLNNAAKYTPAGGRIWLRVSLEDGKAVLRIKDTGVGISEQLLPQVFDLFTQGDRALDRAEGGLGVGLALVRKLVTLHGGTVEGLSQGPGKGSEFVVRLPLQIAASTLPPARERKKGKTGGASRPRRVLVVDDNRDSTESMAMLLHSWGHDVREAHDGPTTLAIAAQWRPDVVLLDIGLPQMSGYDVATRLRALPGCSRVSIVAMTGYGQESDRERSRASGFVRHLVKPVDPSLLRQVLESLPQPPRTRKP